LAPIDASKAAAGKVLYEQHCSSCHAMAVDRTAANRSIDVTMTLLEKIGTDPLMTMNASTREGTSGVLEGVSMPPLIGDPLGAREKSFTITGNVVVGAILAPPEFTDPRVGSLDEANQKLLRAITTNSTVKRDLLGDLRAAADRERDLSDIYEQAKAFMANRREGLALQYKARPLNGIWATAPYLHNGSVPNLYQLLLPSANRDATFTVGSREFDLKNVGFLFGPQDGSFTFDTSLPGNSNKGHEGRDYGTGPDQMTDEQRWQLLEYLKTL
jgi:cytochrome c551/c552